jgi:hypothetical protein
VNYRPYVQIEIVGGARTLCRNSWNFRNINSPFARIYHVNSGRGYVEHHGKMFALEPGPLYLIPSHALSHYVCPFRMSLNWVHVTALVNRSLDLFSVLEDEPRLMPHLHLSLQAMDDLVLKRMKRGASGDIFLKLLEKIRRRIPGVAIRTSMIVGFPGETAADFENDSLRYAVGINGRSRHPCLPQQMCHLMRLFEHAGASASPGVGHGQKHLVESGDAVAGPWRPVRSAKKRLALGCEKRR